MSDSVSPGSKAMILRVAASTRSARMHRGAAFGAAVVAALFLAVVLQRDPDPAGQAPPLSAAQPDEDAPRLASKISELDFEDRAIGERAQKRFVLFHDGSVDRVLTVHNAWMSEPDALNFSTDFSGPVELTAGESIVVTVTFAPGAVGSFDAAVYVSHDGASGLEIFGLSGTGTPGASGSTRAATRGVTRAAPVAPEFQRRAKATFGKSLLAGLSGTKPTSLQFGPDGRLYVADMFGQIRRIEVEREGKNDYEVRSIDTINLVRDMPNHDDDGDPAPKVKNRLVTGLLVTGTASNPVIYVASSDPRIGGGFSHTDTNLDTNSGVISRLTLNNGGWSKLDLVRGLSRSEENHHTNGMVLDESTNTLYIGAGGNTNLGAPSNNFAKLPEYALSAAILAIDLGVIGNSTYDIPTLDDDSRPGTNDRNDPFGGNGGKNQAKLIPGGPVRVHAPGFRNPYDLVLTEDGRMYTVDNGGNAGWGGTPKGGSACTNAQSEPGGTFFDGLHFIDAPGYYGGHANPTRGNVGNTFNSNGQSPVAVSNPIECNHKGTGSNGSLASYGTSLNGLVEYRASNFDGDMQGDLLGVGFDNKVYRTVLNAAGDDAIANGPLFSNVGGIPLDVTAQADWQIFPGTIWVADFQKQKIVVFEPNDYNGSIIAACGTSPGFDDDGDGFSNADEKANGTDPCSSADIPADTDGDKISDLKDSDDDNDGLPDVSDPFVLDASNGRATSIPLDYDWENNSAAAGGLFNLGFTGLMNDGFSDWTSRFDSDNLTASGAAGVFTIDAVPDSDPILGRNDQRYGFQFGVDVTPATAPFVAHTRLVAPFAGASRKPYQSLGFFIGTGDQDNYIKLVANTGGPQGGVQFAAERAGSFTDVFAGAASVYDSEYMDLFLLIDPGAGTVRAFHRTHRAGKDGDIIAAGGATALPKAWLTGSTGLAVGLISTSTGAEPFTATWDFVRLGDPGILALAKEAGTGTGTGAGTTTGTATGGDAFDGSDTHQADDDGRIVVEAERAARSTVTTTHAWQSVSVAGASGTAMTTIDAGALKFDSSDSPGMSYEVEFPAAGRWYVWVRGWGDQASNGEGKSDSVHVGLDGGLSSASAMDGFPARWAWTNGRRAAVRAWIDVPVSGRHELDVWMREDGLVLDRLLLTMDPSYQPAGVGPVSVLIADSGGATSGGSTTSTGSTTGSNAGDTAGAGATGGSTTGVATTDGSATAGETTDAGTTGGATTGSATTGGSATAGTTTAGGASNGVVVLEAEALGALVVSPTHRWELFSDPAAAGGQAMRAVPDVGKLHGGKAGSPQISYPVVLPDAGTWYVWVRGWGDQASNGEGKNDSVHIGVDGLLAEAASMDGFPPGWNWSRSTRAGSSARIQVASGGAHVIDVWMREDGFAIDRIALTQDPGWVPGGTGPQATGSGATTGSATGSTSGGTSGGSGTADGTTAGTASGGGSVTGGTASGGNGEVHVATDAVVLIPARALTSSQAGGGHAWTPQGAQALAALPNNGTLRVDKNASPAVDYKVRFDRPGTWQVWVHGLGDEIGNEGKNDSVHVGLDGNLSSAAAIQGFPPSWTWSSETRSGQPATINVAAAGDALLSVWMREDGFAFDAISLIGPGASISEPGANSPGATTGGSGATGGEATAGSTGGTATGSSRVPAAAQWQRLASADGSGVVARHETGGVSFNGKFYVVGGRASRPVSIFDPATRKWSTGAAPPIELNHFQPVVFDDSIWVIGAMTGGYPNETSVPHIYRYVPANNAWVKGAQIPAARRRGSMGAAVKDGKIYLFGGNTKGHNGGAVAWLDVLDPVTGSWQVLPAAPRARDHAPIAIVGNQLVAAAGRQTRQPDVFSNMVAPVDVYDIATGSWSSSAQIPTQRAGTMVVTVGNEVVVMGGETDKVQSARNSVEAFDVIGRTWRTLGKLAQGVHSGAAALLADGIHVATGNAEIGGGAESSIHQVLRFDR